MEGELFPSGCVGSCGGFWNWRVCVFLSKEGEFISYSLLCTVQYDNEAKFFTDTNAIEFANKAL